MFYEGRGGDPDTRYWMLDTGPDSNREGSGCGEILPRVLPRGQEARKPTARSHETQTLNQPIPVFDLLIFNPADCTPITPRCFGTARAGKRQREKSGSTMFYEGWGGGPAR